MLVFPKNAEKNASIIEKGLLVARVASRQYYPKKKLRTAGFTLKTNPMLTDHTTSKKLKTQRSPVILSLFSRKTPKGKSHIVISSYTTKSSVFKILLSVHKAGVLKFLRFEKCFSKAAVFFFTPVYIVIVIRVLVEYFIFDSRHNLIS